MFLLHSGSWLLHTVPGQQAGGAFTLKGFHPLLTGEDVSTSIQQVSQDSFLQSKPCRHGLTKTVDWILAHSGGQLSAILCGRRLPPLSFMSEHV